MTTAIRHSRPWFIRAASGLGVRDSLLKLGKRVYPASQPFIKQVRMHDFWMLALANEDVGRRMVMLKRYETREAMMLASMVRPADTCVDVGANTGFYTMLLASRAVAGSVHAFEPVPLNHHLVSAGALLNGFSHVVVNAAAAGASVGETEFSEAVDGAYSSIVPVGRRSERRSLRVRVTTLDAYCNQGGLGRIDVLKVDAEGAEPLVLAGARGMLEDPACRPRVMMLELYDDNLAPYGSSVAELVAAMAAHGYVARHVPESGRLEPFGPGQYNAYQNVFFLDPSRAGQG